MAICAEAADPAKGGVLERFYSENDGATLRRLPSWVMPQPSAMMLANEDLKDDPVTGAHARIFDLLRDRSDWNVITFALRCVPDLSSPVIEQRVAAAYVASVFTPSAKRAKSLSRSRPPECAA